MKIMRYVKERFNGNPSFCAEFKKFMDDLITKGYARMEVLRPLGNTWFISHHWVYHPSKPGKIRAVFDSSVEFDEQSLNKELVTGSDLTNQIV